MSQNIEDLSTDEENQSQNLTARSQYWVFTHNNYTPVDLQYYDSLVSTGKATYVVYGLEVGSRGTPHVQAYIEFPRRLRFNQVTRLLPRCRVADRRGTAEEASNYCKKDGDVHEFGVISKTQQGKRNDLANVVQLVKQGASLKRIASQESSTFIKYHKSIGVLRSLLAVEYAPAFHGPFKWPIPDKIETLILWGPSGIGKTEFAKFLLPKALFVTHLDQLTAYASEEYEGIVFDDMSFTHIHREAQIHLVDFDNSRAIHVRYTFATIPRSTPKIFTTNVINGNIFMDDPAINRRINKVNLVYTVAVPKP